MMKSNEYYLIKDDILSLTNEWGKRTNQIINMLMSHVKEDIRLSIPLHRKGWIELIEYDGMKAMHVIYFKKEHDNTGPIHDYSSKLEELKKALLWLLDNKAVFLNKKEQKILEIKNEVSNLKKEIGALETKLDQLSSM